MSPSANDIQTDFLGRLALERRFVWVFLLNGVKLSGQLVSFDEYAIELFAPAGTQVVLKTAVSTVCEPHVFEPGRRSESRSATSVERRPRGGTKLDGGRCKASRVDEGYPAAVFSRQERVRRAHIAAASASSRASK